MVAVWDPYLWKYSMANGFCRGSIATDSSEMCFLDGQIPRSNWNWNVWLDAEKDINAASTASRCGCPSELKTFENTS